MSENKCPQCGAPLDPGATECKFCGEKLATQKAAQQLHQPQQAFQFGLVHASWDILGKGNKK